MLRTILERVMINVTSGKLMASHTRDVVGNIFLPIPRHKSRLHIYLTPTNFSPHATERFTVFHVAPVFTSRGLINLAVHFGWNWFFLVDNLNCLCLVMPVLRRSWWTPAALWGALACSHQSEGLLSFTPVQIKRESNRAWLIIVIVEGA